MASTSLTRTFSAGNNQIFTFSAWIKNSNPDYSTDSAIFGNYTDNDNWFKIDIQGDNNQFRFVNKTSASINANVQISAVTRDVNGWYHLVVSVDTTQATASDRIKIYVNGTLQSSFVSSTYPSQNTNLEVNEARSHSVGAWNSSQYHDGSMAHVHFIDGTAYDASAFGETDTASGIWKPKTSPSVTYGTNGFFLKFANSGSLGTDSSGNGNNFTVNGTGTQTLDTPSNVFATLNPLYVPKNSSPTFSNGNLTSTSSNISYFGGVSTLSVSSGKWYWEVKCGSANTEPVIDVGNPDNYVPISFNSGDGAYLSYAGDGYGYRSTGTKVNNNVNTSYGNSWTAGDIISVAMDLDNHKIYFAKNGVWQNSGDPTSGATGTGAAFSMTTGLSYVAGCGDGASGSGDTQYFNFGNGYFGTTAVSSGNADGDGYGIFEYAPPTGYYALCTKNINTYG